MATARVGPAAFRLHPAMEQMVLRGRGHRRGSLRAGRDESGDTNPAGSTSASGEHACASVAGEVLRLTYVWRVPADGLGAGVVWLDTFQEKACS
jgi:hypothetical protein